MTHIPAEPGTMLINLDPNVEPVPIVAWEIAGNRVFPVYPFLRDGLRGGDGFLMGVSGTVVDPHMKTAYDDADLWRQDFNDQDEPPYEIGKALGAGKAPPSPSAEPRTRTDVEIEPATPGQIAWDKKGLQNNSWWHYDDGEEQFVFEVPGGEVRPKDDNVTKLTRKKFFELRKELTVKSVVPGDEPTEEDLVNEDDDDLGGLV